MSELKEFEVNGRALFGRFYTKKAYDKDEVDKVIAELKESHKTEVKELLCLIRDKDNNFNRAFDSEEKELRHQKYKLCLAMAKWCDEMMMSCELRGYAIHRIWYNRHQWAMRWKYRWLKIAEKFKPNNSTAQQGKGK